jgi:hypothetical protein
MVFRADLHTGPAANVDWQPAPALEHRTEFLGYGRIAGLVATDADPPEHTPPKGSYYISNR